MVTKFEFSDNLVYCGQGGAASRHRGKLVFTGPGEPFASGPVLFEGKSIPGVCRVERSSYTKNGKWSYTTWWLAIPDGVKAWTQKGGCVRPLPEETVPDDVPGRIRYHRVTSWSEVDATEVRRDVVRTLCPRTAERLDTNEQPI